MDTIIDHAILIPAPANMIWAQISDPEKNPIWQEECDSISFVTSHQRGRGARWRYTHRAGEIVILITAWYEGLGYEYTIVDGVPYDNDNRGRIRLQETADGTVVQWTFSYAGGGMFSGLGGRKRRIDRNIVDSLRNLYQYVKDTHSDNFTQSKTIMRDAPDVFERAEYQRQYPLQPGENPADAAYMPPQAQQDAPDDFSSFGIEEPPITDDDTHPNPTIKTPQSLEEPSFLRDVPEESLPPTIMREPRDADYSEPPIDNTAVTPPKGMPAVQPDTTPEATSEPPTLPSRSNLGEDDKSQKSVFELFGLQKPSQAQPETPKAEPEPTEEKYESPSSGVEDTSETLAVRDETQPPLDNDPPTVMGYDVRGEAQTSTEPEATPAQPEPATSPTQEAQPEAQDDDTDATVPERPAPMLLDEPEPKSENVPTLPSDEDLFRFFAEKDSDDTAIKPEPIETLPEAPQTSDITLDTTPEEAETPAQTPQNRDDTEQEETPAPFIEEPPLPAGSTSQLFDVVKAVERGESLDIEDDAPTLFGEPEPDIPADSSALLLDMVNAAQQGTIIPDDELTQQATTNAATPPPEPFGDDVEEIIVDVLPEPPKRFGLRFLQRRRIIKSSHS